MIAVFTRALCAALLVSAFAAVSQSQTLKSGGDDLMSLVERLGKNASKPYRAQVLGTLRKTDTARWHTLMHDGAVYLSIRDVVALAIDNNLDIEAARLLPGIAKADALRASAGQLLRNIPPTISIGPPSAQGPLASSSSLGYEGLTTTQLGVLSGLSVQLAGSQIPNLDPVLVASGTFSHLVDPESNRIVTGTNSLVSDSRQWQAELQKSFLTGTTVDLAWTAIHLDQNAPNNTINPALSANASLTLKQHLLQGFSLAANSRAIRIARNSQAVSSLLFQNQVIETVTEVVNLYYDLVAFREQLAVLRRALGEDRRLLDETKRQLDLGLVTQADVAHAEAEAGGAEQTVQSTELQVLEQELTLKSALTRDGLADPDFLSTPLVLIDKPQTPTEPSLAAQDFALEVEKMAIRSRIEIKESDIGMRNKKISLEGTRNALKPSLEVYVKLQSNALAGALNSQASLLASGPVDPVFLGGTGNAWNQILRGQFPNYVAGFQLNIPLRNRAAQADMIRDQLDLRDQEIADQKLHNGIRLQALKSAAAFQQSAKEYFAAVRTRQSRQTSYDDEQKAADFGNSNARRLSDARRELELSELTEITALNTYARAKNNLEAVEGKTWEAFHLSLQDALHESRLPY